MMDIHVINIVILTYLWKKTRIKLYNNTYSPYLFMRYQTHVNIEYCNKSNSIKYLFKYSNKGPNRATIKISSTSSESPDTPIVDIMTVDTYHHVKQFGEYLVFTSTIDGLLSKD